MVFNKEMRQEKSNQDNRKLAAIVFTDIAGFTELTSKNEDDALELVEYQRNVLKPIVEKYQGVLVKGNGGWSSFNFWNCNKCRKLLY